MPPAMPPEKRAAITQAIRDGGTAHGIARQYEVAQSTVSRIAVEEGIEGAFDRTSTKRASAARQADLSARRAELAELLMEDAFRLRDRAWQRQEVLVQFKESTTIEEVETPAGDFRNFYTSIGIIVDKVNVLTRDDSSGLAAIDHWLQSLGVGGTA